MPDNIPHPEGGEVVAVNIDGKLYINPANQAYLKSLKTLDSLDKIESKTVNHTGFSKSRIINDDEKSEREQQLDRLTLMKTNRARLLKQLAQIESVIKSIETDLSI